LDRGRAKVKEIATNFGLRPDLIGIARRCGKASCGPIKRRTDRAPIKRIAAALTGQDAVC
jgi:hypothetical protein